LINISQFEKLNVADTCSLWNILASPILSSNAEMAGVQLCSTTFVLYECLNKPGQVRPERAELQKRLKRKLDSGSIRCHPIDIEDLQDFEVLKNRKKLSTGELSVVVFARKTRQAVLTDDIGAQKLARRELGADLVQSTPHLFAWLYFNSRVNDSDKDQIVSDLLSLGRSLQPHLDEFHTEAQRCRAIANQSNPSGSRGAFRPRRTARAEQQEVLRAGVLRAFCVRHLESALKR
jgi:hypothetical protein